MHWDGASWTAKPPLNHASVEVVEASSGADVWALRAVAAEKLDAFCAALEWQQLAVSGHTR